MYNMNDLIHHGYLKKQLFENIKNNMIEQITKSKVEKKDWQNNSYKLRSALVLNKLAEREKANQLEMQLQAKSLPRTKFSQRAMSSFGNY